MIRARSARPVPKIEIDPKTGLPTVNGQTYAVRNSDSRKPTEVEVAHDEQR